MNLSTHSLTPGQISLLSKGLKFCPAPGQHELADIKIDLDRFHPSLHLKHFFSNQDNQSTLNSQPSTASLLGGDTEGFDHPNFRNKSKWSPKGPPSLESFIITNETRFINCSPFRRPRDNLGKSERQALKELKMMHHITIKPADKGSAVVLQNTMDYIAEGLRQLRDAKFYRESPVDLTEVHVAQITSVVTEMFNNKEISKKCKEYLLNYEIKPARFYTLPKIHKGIYPPPGRPIISGNGCPTERISQFVDHFLNNISCKGKSFIKDTSDFLRMLNDLGKVPKGSFLVTLDVVSLYPNIPIADSISACAAGLESFRPNGTEPRNSSILRLLRLVMLSNHFTFCVKHYLQISGTATGTKAALNVAITFMNKFEDDFVYTYALLIFLWKRFIDDCFLIWTHSLFELVTFEEYLNSRVETIKFTFEASLSQVNFLDTTVHLEQDGSIWTDLYCKPTDSHSYLRFDSSHSGHCCRSLPYSQFLRIRRNVVMTQILNDMVNF